MNFVTKLFGGLGTKDKKEEAVAEKAIGAEDVQTDEKPAAVEGGADEGPSGSAAPAGPPAAAEENGNTIGSPAAPALRGAENEKPPTSPTTKTREKRDSDNLPGPHLVSEGGARQASVSVSSTRSSSDEEETLLVRDIDTGEIKHIDAVYDKFEYSTFSETTPKNSVGEDDGTQPADGDAATDAPAKKKVSVSLDSFHLNRVLGKGAFAKVLLVQKEDSGSMYAMKVLKKHHVARKNQIEHTRTERRILAQVHHPFICLLRYAFQTKSKLYLVLDYHPGGELFYHLSRRGRFREQEAKFFIAEITSALEYLHDNGICYRDLKPENVLIQTSGHIALTDFGLSKDSMESQTSGGKSFCGTPEYLAPEIIHRKGHGKAVDWWSLGMVSYELLTGLPPWYTKNRLHLFEDICWAPLRFARHVSQEARSLIRGLLTREPSDRFTAKEAKANVFFADLDWDDVYGMKLKPVIIPAEGTAYISRDIRKLPVISTTEKGEDQETAGRDRSFNSTEFDGYSFEGMSGANPTGQNVLEAAAKATIGRRDTSNDDSPGPKVAPGSPEETTL
jgi:serine/threonine protein kinase